MQIPHRHRHARVRDDNELAFFSTLLVLLWLGSTLPLFASEVPVLVFKDGMMIGLVEYRVAQGRISYTTTYGGKNTVPLALVDIERTQAENEKRGTSLDFTERPASAGTTAATTPGAAKEDTAATGKEMHELMLVYPPPSSSGPLWVITNDNLSSAISGTPPPTVFTSGARAEFRPATFVERQREEIRVGKEVELSRQLHLEPRKQEIETLAAQYQRLLQGCFDCTDEEASRFPPPTPAAGLGQAPEVLELQRELEGKLRAVDAEEKHYREELRDQVRRRGMPRGWLREPPPNSEIRKEVTRELAGSQAAQEEKTPSFSEEDFRTPEAYWRFRKRMAEMDERIAELDVLLLEQQLQTVMTNWLLGTRCWEGRGCTFNLGNWDIFYRSYTAELRGQLAKKQAQLQEARRLLADLPDELRRAGGQAGWLR